MNRKLGSPESGYRDLLIVLAGKPGTGKTTVGRLLAGRLRAAYLRTDVVDGVHATRELRARWRTICEATDCRLVQLEMTLSDAVEHRRRVEDRQAEGYRGPTWEQIQDMPYDVWNESVDGRRLVVDAFDTNAALARCLAYVEDWVSA